MVSTQYHNIMGGLALYQKLERLATLLRAEERQAGQKYGLQPVQLQALHYLSRCNHYSNTPAAVTDYLGLTKGTVSQSLLLLEKMGHITKRVDPEDRRVVRLALTFEGQAVLHDMLPPPALTRAVQDVPAEDLETLEGGLVKFLRQMQRANNCHSFGECRSCHFFQREEAGYRCGLTQEPLRETDTMKICREHEHPAEPDP